MNFVTYIGIGIRLAGNRLFGAAAGVPLQPPSQPALAGNSRQSGVRRFQLGSAAELGRAWAGHGADAVSA